ncbi:MAG: hypothetical protein WCY05_07020 [Candidatus Omnitrophota bacterium]
MKNLENCKDRDFLRRYYDAKKAVQVGDLESLKKIIQKDRACMDIVHARQSGTFYGGEMDYGYLHKMADNLENNQILEYLAHLDD